MVHVKKHSQEDETGHAGQSKQPRPVQILNKGLLNVSRFRVWDSFVFFCRRSFSGGENDFTIDSSGFGTSRFVKWFDHKYGKDKDVRTWVKAHLVCGVKTNIVTAVELTMTNKHDSKFLPELVMQTAHNFNIKEVSGDKAYSSRANLELINELGAVPYIPFKKGTTGRAKNAPTWKRMSTISSLIMQSS